MKFIITPNNFTVFVNGQPHMVAKDHPFYLELKQAVKDNDENAFQELFSKKDKVEVVLSNDAVKQAGVDYQNGVVYYNGKELHSSLARRIVEIANDGLPIEGMLKFLENLMQNPSSNSVNQAYTFLENKHLAITEDGCFLAYKAVRSDYLDKHSGTFDNSPGQIHEIERNQVDDNIENECSFGFHVGGLDYSGPGGSFHGGGDKTVIVKVNPKDVVAVPRDYNFQKMRVCRYEVVGDYVCPMRTAVYTADGRPCDRVVNSAYEPLDNYFDLVEGDVIKFTYTKSDGEVSERVDLVVTELDFDEEDEDYVLLSENGRVKRFVASQMSNLYVKDTDQDILDVEDEDDDEFEEEYDSYNNYDGYYRP